MSRLAAITSLGAFGTKVHADEDHMDHVSLGDFLPKVKMTQTLKALSAGRFHSVSDYASFFQCDRSHGLNGLNGLGRHLTGFTDAENPTDNPTENPTEKILQMNSKVVNITGRLGEKQLKDWRLDSWTPSCDCLTFPRQQKMRTKTAHHGSSEDRMPATWLREGTSAA